MMRRHFMFSALVGQEQLKRAYLANIVNPRIGGLLISGPKGTGKSTVVHSVEDILPSYSVVDGCIFNCNPDSADEFCSLCRERNDRKPVTRKMKIFTLPLSCTEDRLIGSIDIETLLKTGKKVVIPGILGKANRNILYIDEVNLLPDHLVDDVLDAAALHWNTIEREGISISHSADFVFVGSMNPEEGDLRPQILDRFPLCAKISSAMDSNQRMEIIKRNLLFEHNYALFRQQFRKAEEEIADRIVSARRLLSAVDIDDTLIRGVADSCVKLKVDGQRPDIVIVKTARTLAALDGRKKVSAEDIMQCAELALVHRTRDGGLLEPPTSEEIQNAFGKIFTPGSGRKT